MTWLALLLISSAHAAPEAPSSTERVAPVVGGQPSEPGNWPDAASVAMRCTGTLIHPEWILTAAHCLFDDYGNANEVGMVMLGSSTYTPVWEWWGQGRPLAGRYGEEGEAFVSRVVGHFVHPKYVPQSLDSGVDLALLQLAAPVEHIEPRVIAQDCIVEDDLTAGADVSVVGWGAIDTTGAMPTDVLREAATVIQTADCSEDWLGDLETGCSAIARPAGELGAGQRGNISACYGDSGGPLYLNTERGSFVVGTASRLYRGALWDGQPCTDGVIYARPDAHLAWIRQTTGVKLPRPACSLAPRARADLLQVRPGAGKAVSVNVQDPDSSRFTYELVTPPAHGEVTVSRTGRRVVYTAAADYEGDDSFELRVLDDGHDEWPDNPPASSTFTVDVQVDPSASCSTLPGGSLSWLGLAGLWGIRRRRR